MLDKKAADSQVAVAPDTKAAGPATDSKPAVVLRAVGSAS